MEVAKLIELQSNGALNIKYEKGKRQAELAGILIDEAQAHNIAVNLGWTEYKLSPFEIIDKTNKFIKGLKNNLVRQDILETGYLEFQNIKAVSYGKTFDRIVLRSRYTNVTIIYNMESSGTKYAIYKLGNPLLIGKCKNVKAVAEFINTYED